MMKTNLKAEALPRMGVIDALSTGLVETARRPWLLVIPVAVDLWLWLAPRVSVAQLLERFVRVWEVLIQSTYTAGQGTAMQETMAVLREAARQKGAALNLSDVLAGGWLGAPSAISTGQVTRMTFITDLVLAPAGLTLQLPHAASSPLRFAPWELGGLGAVALVTVALWLAGQVVAAFYLRWVAASWRCGACWAGPRGFLSLVGQLIVFSILVGCVVILLQLPLGFALTLLVLSSSMVVQVMALVLGGVALWLTLWLLSALFFVLEAILLDHQPVWQGLLRSAGLVHRNFGSALALACIINLLMYGFRSVWDLMGTSSFGSVVAIVANAYLATSMLVGIFAFYEDMRKHAVAEPKPRPGVAS